MREPLMRRAKGMIVAAGILCMAPAHAADRELYAIGNSLTVSMLPFSVPDFASQRARSFNVGFYWLAGSALDFIVANPSNAAAGHPVSLDQAFASRVWTDISVQPYPGPTATLASDMAAIQSVVAAARAGTSAAARLFIYSAWPSQASFATGGFASWWRSPVPDVPAQPAVLNRSYADHLHARLVAALGPTTPVHVIPVGDVFAALDDLVRAGQVSGVTDIRQLYSDNDHVGDVGKFIAGLTVYTTLFKDNPTGLGIPIGYVQGSGTAQLTPELAAQLETLVWRVVNSDSRTGVNTPPVAASQSLSTPGSVSLPVTLAATDAEGSSLGFTVVSAPVHGQLSGQPPVVTYVPDPGYQGSDSFSFRVNDGWLDSAPATVSISIQAQVAAPEQAGGGGRLQIPGLLGLAGWLSRVWLRRKTDATLRL